MKILQKSNEKISFVYEINESLANAIRRSVLEIPILAIDEVEFIKNDSVLYDEVLALRLGLIPLKKEKDIVLQEECSCNGKGCSKCSVQLKLKAKGPITVYSKDLNGKCEVIYKDMPIVKLEEDQELEIIAIARLGKGIKHTKFSPGLVYYKNAAEIEVKKDCIGCLKCLDACPQKLLKGNKKPEFINEDAKYKCDLCEACVEECNKNGKNALEINNGKEIVFSIESFGAIPAKEILIESVLALKNNLKEIEKEIK